MDGSSSCALPRMPYLTEQIQRTEPWHFSENLWLAGPTHPTVRTHLSGESDCSYRHFDVLLLEIREGSSRSAYHLLFCKPPGLRHASSGDKRWRDLHRLIGDAPAGITSCRLVSFGAGKPLYIAFDCAAVADGTPAGQQDEMPDFICGPFPDDREAAGTRRLRTSDQPLLANAKVPEALARPRGLILRLARGDRDASQPPRRSASYRDPTNGVRSPGGRCGPGGPHPLDKLCLGPAGKVPGRNKLPDERMDRPKPIRTRPDLAIAQRPRRQGSDVRRRPISFARCAASAAWRAVSAASCSQTPG
jgi:hypothetical protein